MKLVLLCAVALKFGAAYVIPYGLQRVISCKLLSSLNFQDFKAKKVDQLINTITVNIEDQKEAARATEILNDIVFLYEGLLKAADDAKVAALEAKREAIEAKKEAIDVIKDALDSKNAVIASKEKEILQAKGLMNCRSIFEHFAKQCFDELKPILGTNEKFVVSNFLSKISAVGFNVPIQATKTQALLKNASLCNCSLNGLFNTLCNDIHGSPWNGAYIAFYKGEMDPSQACMMEFIANSMGFDLNAVVK
eukprot:CAMPEP_0201093074 /NCGR_PEP_ID=MMETSP0812-20130820/1646_1 /ASSEMBLY_ACC=CAM_ASM_000668 /TAXON_ID=98059 /ORGANISM="Dinobryon sp., Strain UTEXLB2267" /LENGTH=249 /DNA_ID=CAMNT_0047345065 /DNA_START=20 /DNA_END=769 /DNA_ORIENTATION=+